MSLANVELVRSGVEAFNRADIDALLAMAAPDCEYVTSGVTPGLTGSFRLAEFIGRFWSEFEGPRYEVHELIDAGDQVVAWQTIRGRGKQSGAQVSWDIWQVWTVRDGKVVRGQGFTSREEALEAVEMQE